MRNMFAKIIVIEGADAVGKATQSKMLTHSLKRYGDRVKLLEIPFNDGVTFDLLYKMLHNGQAKTHPNLFQFIQFLNKFIVQCTVLLWYWLICDYVILDRWSLSSVIYGDSSGANKKFSRLMYAFLTHPNLTIVLHGNSFARKRANDVYEADRELQSKVRAAYYDWALEFPYSHFIVFNTTSVDVTHDRILNIVNTKTAYRSNDT